MTPTSGQLLAVPTPEQNIPSLIISCHLFQGQAVHRACRDPAESDSEQEKNSCLDRYPYHGA